MRRWMKEFLYHGFMVSFPHHWTTQVLWEGWWRGRQLITSFFNEKNYKGWSCTIHGLWDLCWTRCCGADLGAQGEQCSFLQSFIAGAAAALGFTKCKSITQGAPGCRFCSCISVPSTLSALLMLPACQLQTLECDVSGIAALMHTFLWILACIYLWNAFFFFFLGYEFSVKDYSRLDIPNNLYVFWSSF